MKELGIITRKCKKSDYSFVFNLVKKTLWPYISRYIKPKKDKFDQGFFEDYRGLGYKHITILMKGRRRIGFYQITPENNLLYIRRIFLSPAYQGKGIGKKFMDYFETLGYNKLKLKVWENNPAQRFYKKLGYIIINKKEHRLEMEKRL
tara:strand:- start:549 stop:992 length:444 start_codon:yes stop_codon:yes gene_type:complete